MILVHAFMSVFAAILAGALFAHTPDPDRPRAYPNAPDLWRGVTGEPAFSPVNAYRSALFWAIAASGYGAVAAVMVAVLPDLMIIDTLVAATIGIIVAQHISQRMLEHGPGAMYTLPPMKRRPTVSRRPRVLFIGGSPNQTTQMHQIASKMPQVEAWFSPYFSDNTLYRFSIRLGLLESAIIGFRRRGICLDYLNEHGLNVDLLGELNDYDLVVTCNDQVMPSQFANTPVVLVQEGIQDPPNLRYWIWKYTRLLPRPIPGTSTFGLSHAYDKFCVASHGYARHFEGLGVDPEKIEVTGIPNFDNFARFCDNDFPYRDYVLVCTTDARETGADGDREAFLKEVVEYAGGRQLIFKLHPNENFERATEEIKAVAPAALVYTSGSAEEMVANCSVLFTEWSSLTFCGVALDKEVHSHHPLEKVRELLPLQNRSAAANIASVCRTVLDERRMAERMPSQDHLPSNA